MPKYDDHRFDDYASVVEAHYVRFLEAAGARVVPLLYDADEDVNIALLKTLNGVFMPGGGGDYIALGALVMSEAKKYNDAGTFYPVWATCLGFERMAAYTAAEPLKLLTNIGASHVSLPLEFLVDPAQTKMFCPLGQDAQAFAAKPFTYNGHRWSITDEAFAADA